MRELTSSKGVPHNLLNHVQKELFFQYTCLRNSKDILTFWKNVLRMYVGKDNKLPVTQSSIPDEFQEKLVMGNGQCQGQNFCKMVD